MIPVIKAVNADMSAPAAWHNPFYYPTLGPVQDRDGEGLHGLAWGIGNLNWFNGIKSPKYVVLVAGSVTLLQGKCRFYRADVVGVHDHLADAAVQMASLTLFWTTPKAASMLRNTPEDQHGIVEIALDVKHEIERRIAALVDGVQEREQRWVERTHTGIHVPGWPVRTEQIQEPTCDVTLYPPVRR